MKTLILAVFFLAALVGSVGQDWFAGSAAEEATAIARSAEPREAEALVVGAPVAAPHDADETGERVCVPAVEVETPPDAACARCDALRAELARERLARLRLEHPEDDPWGRFLQSYEAEQITDARELSRLRALLEEFPVFLRPGEGTWIVERFRNDDWKAYGDTITVALVRYLGPRRIQLEGSPELHAYLERWLDDAEWQAFFGTQPPE